MKRRAAYLRRIRRMKAKGCRYVTASKCRTYKVVRGRKLRRCFTYRKKVCKKGGRRVNKGRRGGKVRGLRRFRIKYQRCRNNFRCRLRVLHKLRRYRPCMRNRKCRAGVFRRMRKAMRRIRRRRIIAMRKRRAYLRRMRNKRRGGRRWGGRRAIRHIVRKLARFNKKSKGIKLSLKLRVK
jgi:hypothetical protein